MKRGNRTKDVIAGLTLAGLALALLPRVGRVLVLLFEEGSGSVAMAGLLSASLLVVASSVAAFGVAFSRSWARWSGRGVGLYWVFLSGGVLATRATTRVSDVALLAAGGLLLIALSPRSEDVSESPTMGERLDNLLRGWAIAFNVAFVPALLAAFTSAVADQLERSMLVLGAGIGVSALLILVGVVMVPWTKVAGAGLCLIGSMASAMLLFDVVGSATAGHRELILVYPAGCAAALMLLVFGIRSAKRRGRSG